MISFIYFLFVFYLPSTCFVHCVRLISFTCLPFVFHLFYLSPILGRIGRMISFICFPLVFHLFICFPLWVRLVAWFPSFISIFFTLQGSQEVQDPLFSGQEKSHVSEVKCYAKRHVCRGFSVRQMVYTLPFLK